MSEKSATLSFLGDWQIICKKGTDINKILKVFLIYGKKEE